jgi:hypothetical protein
VGFAGVGAVELVYAVPVEHPTSDPGAGRLEERTAKPMRADPR